MFVPGIRQDGTRKLGCDESSGWIWFAGQALIEVLISKITTMEGLRVLELGSGTGWLAIQLAAKGARVTATERTGACPLLLQNIYSQSPEILANIDVHVLDWTIPKTLDGEWDIIVASDILYLQENYVSLLETIIRHGVAKTSLAYEERKPEEEKNFIVLASQHGFDVKVEEIAINPETQNQIYMLTLIKQK